jgi:hypothetical protein
VRGGKLPLKVTILDVCDEPIANATFSASAMDANGQPISNASSPLTFAYAGPWPHQVSIDAKAPFFYDANVVISYDGQAKTWSSNGAVIIGEGDPDRDTDRIDVRIYLCRVRFAPVATEDLSQKYPSDLRASGAIRYPRYPTQSLPRPPVLNSPCSDPSTPTPGTQPNPITGELETLGYGFWLNLEVGDPPGSKNGEIRQLIGVWAPFRTATTPALFRTATTPAVIYQITPSTAKKSYPQDIAFPFTGIYPYGCSDAEVKGEVLGTSLTQSYVLLPLRRTLWEFAAAYQIYGACPSLYDINAGPIIITYSPAYAAGAEVVEPFDCRETMGRLIGEVLCFLWSKRITGTSLAGSSHVDGRIQVSDAGVVTYEPTATGPRPYDPFPKSCQTTTLVHSAAIARLVSLIQNTTFANLQTSIKGDKDSVARLGKFDAKYCAGDTSYGNASWSQAWIIDGIVGTGDYVPSAGSPTSKSLKDWRDEWKGLHVFRSYCAVYTEPTMSLDKTTDLVSHVELPKPKPTASDWIEEGIDYIKDDNNMVLLSGAWLRLSKTMVMKIEDDKSRPKLKTPDLVHNLIYRYGISYCALVSAPGNITPPPVGNILPS